MIVWILAVIAIAIAALFLWTSYDALFKGRAEERVARELVRRRLELDRLEREAIAHEARTRQAATEAFGAALDAVHQAPERTDGDE